ncbi:MAG: prepilin-type N-terminal cleavage/methylation domain-containing protein [Pseudomonadota bacterium]
MRKKIYQSGFTLVEMSIVLVIVGLILGAVSIGKDLQRDAEYNKIKQKFIDQWVQAYGTYYQRSGVVLGDSQTEPRFMINGINYTPTVSANVPLSGGDMTSISGPSGICQGFSAPGMIKTASNVNLHEYMDKLGIRMPPGRAEGQEDRYVYLDSNGNPQEVQICFQWNSPNTPSGSGNVMVITGITPDLARTLDQMIDGKPDAREGLFRHNSVTNSTSGSAGVEWGTDNTYAYATTDSSNRDESQITTVVAHYKMNQ